MKGTTLSLGLVRFIPGARTVLEAGRTFNRQHMSAVLELSALIIAWSAVMAMSLALAGLLLGEH